MKWEPSLSDGKPSKYQIRSGDWAIAKVWGYHQKAYVYELYWLPGTKWGVRVETFPTGEAAKDEAQRRHILGLGGAPTVGREAAVHRESSVHGAPVAPSEGRFDELRRIIAGDSVSDHVDGE